MGHGAAPADAAAAAPQARKELLPVMDWFSEFCEGALGAEAAAQLLGTPAPCGGAKAAGAKDRASGQARAVKRGRGAAADDAEGGASGEGEGGAGKKARRGGPGGSEAARRQMLQLAARFSAAAAGLQAMGMWRQSRVRREQMVQRTCYAAVASAELAP